MESRAIGHQSNCTGSGAAIDASAATPSVLNINEPITVPSPRSDSLNVLMTFVKNSGAVVATAINVAAAKCFGICK